MRQRKRSGRRRPVNKQTREIKYNKKYPRAMQLESHQRNTIRERKSAESRSAQRRQDGPEMLGLMAKERKEERRKKGPLSQNETSRGERRGQDTGSVLFVGG